MSGTQSNSNDDQDYAIEKQTKAYVDKQFDSKQMSIVLANLFKDRNFDEIFIDAIISIFKQRKDLQEKFVSQIRKDMFFGGFLSIASTIGGSLIFIIPALAYTIEIIKYIKSLF